MSQQNLEVLMTYYQTIDLILTFLILMTVYSSLLSDDYGMIITNLEGFLGFYEIIFCNLKIFNCNDQMINDFNHDENRS